MTKYLLIDANSIGFAAQGAKHKLSLNGRETTAIFGVIRSLRVLCDENPDATPIVFWDGRSWRYDHFKGYKDGREKDPKQAAERAAYKEQRPSIAKALKLLGVAQHMALNTEADDLIALFTETMPPSDRATIVSGDRDLLQLVNERVDWFNPVRLPGGKLPKLLRVTHDSFAEDTGYEDANAFVKGKAFLGDKSDNLDGVAGIGEKAAPLIVKTWPNVNDMIEDIRLRGDAAIPPYLSRFKKKLKDFAASPVAQRSFVQNYRLMRLTPKFIPKPVGLRIQVSRLDEKGFEEFCKHLGFVSILRDLKKWTAPFAAVETQKEAA